MADTKRRTTVIVVLVEMAVIAWVMHVLFHPGPAIYVLLILYAVSCVSAAVRARWVIKGLAAGKKWFEDSLKKWRTNPFQWG